eukprot:c8823_g1_i1 orf=423-2060(-)
MTFYQRAKMRKCEAVVILTATLVLTITTTIEAQGSWEIVVANAGIASMHTAVTSYGTVVLLDRTDTGASQINLTAGRCRDDAQDLTLQHDCTAHSVIFTPWTNSIRPLFIQTDTWCSSGQFFSDGTLVQTGGNYDGFSKVRRFTPCATDGTCDWVESTDEFLQNGRWYATNQLLPDGSRQIIVGGLVAFTYEFIPANGAGATTLPFLQQTDDAQNDNYYPYVHLLPDGTLYIFANRDSIILNYETNTVVKTFPTIPGEPRNYPSAGSSVLLPLHGSDGYSTVEVLICGGAQYGAFLNVSTFPPASQTCGRITVTSSSPAWEMEDMPYRRTMGDMLLLPTGNVLIINGAQNGCQGYGHAINAALNPVIYEPDAASGERFVTQSATTIARVYHSTANLLPDGRILVAGSNTYQSYTFTGDFPTELRVEAFSPDYLSSANNNIRPTILTTPGSITYGSNFVVTASVNELVTGNLVITLISAPFTTHSYSQGLRLLVLPVVSQTTTGTNSYSITVTSPPSGTVAPPSYYMLFVVNQGIPSTAAWVHVSS